MHTSVEGMLLWNLLNEQCVQCKSFSDILRKAEFFVSSWKMARAANPMRALQTHDNGLQRAPVISYEELSGDRRPLFQ